MGGCLWGRTESDMTEVISSSSGSGRILENQPFFLEYGQTREFLLINSQIGRDLGCSGGPESPVEESFLLGTVFTKLHQAVMLDHRINMGQAVKLDHFQITCY